jgi:tRNA(fMet)-specific endonuclease VapC
MYLLDTNVIIDIIRGKYPALKNHFMQTKISDIFIPSIVVAELEFGAKHSNNYLENRQKFIKVIKNFKILAFTDAEAVFYGEIRQNLTSRGLIIGPNDLLIAATALANNGILITHNTNEFKRVENLTLEDWTK